MRQLVLIAALLTTLAAPAWGWNDDAQRCYRKEGHLDGVIAHCTCALNSRDLSQADRAYTFNNRGIAYRAKGEHDRAIADCNESLRLRPNDANTLHSRAYAYEQKGDLVQAERDYRQVLSVDPNHADSRRDLDRLTQQLATAAAAQVATQLVLPPPAKRRAALVIGNGAYTNAPALDNPANDARAVAASLRRLGFEVMEGIDLDRSGMDDALLAFAREAEAADDALVFYAGHGIQVDGRNYLLPIDVRLNDVHDLRRYLTADQVISDAAGAQRFALVILDACRDNPFVRSLAQRRGKAEVAPDRRTEWRPG